MIRKFYDPQESEIATSEPESTVNVAALMAKHGVKNSNEQPVAAPIVIQPTSTQTEKKEEPTTAQPTPVEATTEASNAEKATPETPTQLPEESASEEPQKVAEPVKPPTLQEVLKNYQPEAVLKELGFDDKAVKLARELNGFEKTDFFVNLLTNWKTNGDLNSYLRELSTDYLKMSAEDVMRHQLRRDYPKAGDKQLEILFNTKVIKAFNLDSDDEDEAGNGRLLLEAEADRHRDSLIANQQQYLFPKPPEPKAPEPDLSEQVQAQEFEAYRSAVTDHPYTKQLFTSGQMSIGDGEEKFNFPVNANDLSDILFNPDKWVDTMFEKDGEKMKPKVEHQLLVAAVAKYGDKFLKEYAKHFKSLGSKAAIDPIDNAKPPEQNSPSPAEQAPSTAAEAMAKQGRFNSGGY